MPGFNLIIGLLIILGVTKITTERFPYTKKQRVTNFFILIAGFIILYFGYKCRVENNGFILGVLPNFLTGLFYPSLIVMSGFRVKNFLKKEEYSWIIFTLFIWTLYEFMLIFDGRFFDIFDIIATLIGSVISVPILLMLTSSTHNTPNDHYDN
ncbi:hypothetical protein [Algoriphagus machipongonensis]|uniref:Malate permease n=1 Tax=Algoriphagus machipongonensis TaxID=388413 RepID=A3I2I7_9BACT|nr:hypothetical protein [Algoriphagus machipongonensis]EAZ79291.1 malate permease [Algoriphagus machipongonensis]